MLRDSAIKGARNSACDASQGIGVSAKRNRWSDCAFVILRFKERCNRLRYRALARLIERVRWSDAGNGVAQVVSELLLDKFANFFLRGALPCEECRRGGGFRSPHTLWMIVRDLCAGPRFCAHLLKCVKRIGDRTNSHGRTITPTVVGFTAAAMHPVKEPQTITPIGISVGVLMELIDIRRSGQHTVSHSNCKYGVIGEPAIGHEQWKVRRLGHHKFVNRADDVACDRS